MFALNWFNSTNPAEKTHTFQWDRILPDGEFNTRSKRLAFFLAERFPQKQSRIALWGETGEDYLAAFVAVLRAGHTAVPLDTRMGAHELADAVRNADVVGMLVARNFPQSFGEELGGVKIYPLNPHVESRDETASHTVLTGCSEHDTAVLISSSNPNRRRLLIPLSLQSLIAHAEAANEHLRVTASDTWLVPLPLHQAEALATVFRCLLSGASLSLSSVADADEINHKIDTGRVTLVTVTPALLDRMIKRRGLQPYPKTLRAIIVSGGAVPGSLLARCPQACVSYGVSEAGSMVACARPRKGFDEHMSAGPALPRTEIKIVDSNGKGLQRGATGQIVVRGPGMAKAYAGNMESTARTFVSGWIFTGDSGYLDTEGYLHISASRNEITTSSAEVVCCAEIQTVLQTHPRVESAAVMKLQDREHGESTAALVVLTPGRALEKIHIYQYLEGKLARYKFPRRIVFTSSLPLLLNGKPDVATMRVMLSEKLKVET